MRVYYFKGRNICERKFCGGKFCGIYFLDLRPYLQQFLSTKMTKKLFLTKNPTNFKENIQKLDTIYKTSLCKSTWF